MHHCGTSTAPVLAPRRPSSAYILQAWQSNSDSIWLCHVSLFDVEKRVACNPMTYVGNTIQGLWRDACLLAGMAEPEGQRGARPSRFWQVRKRRRQCRCAALLLSTPDFQTFRHLCCLLGLSSRLAFPCRLHDLSASSMNFYISVQQRRQALLQL